MSIYHRFASLEHDEAFFKRQPSEAGASKKRPSRKSSKHKLKLTRSASNDSSTSDYGVLIHIPPLGGQFRVSNTTGNWKNKRRNEYVNNDHTMIEGDFGITRQSPTAHSRENTLQEWASIFPRSAYFTGHDKDLFGDIIIFIYENPETGRINTKSITKFGVTTYDNLILDSRSRFWPSCENLLPEYRRSNVRRAMAITNLKNYNKLSNNHFEYLELKEPWDETNAGSLANEMYLLTDKTPLDLGQKLLQLGLIQSHSVKSVLVDTVYDNYSDQTTEKIIEDNNRMVYLLGDQLDQLFDPLLEYSPEQMQINYNVLASDFKNPPMLLENENISSIVAELISIQTNYTMGLVNLLQNFIIPLRIHVLSNASSTSASAQKTLGIFKINQVFPPTIDEITRINCILHDSLNKAKYYGYMEIFKCLGMILPYFYKAFIRHEANLKNFSSRFNKFSQKNHKRIFENKKLNKGEYSVREIESVVSGSLFELPRLKLILKRLYDTIRSEMSAVRDSKTYSRAREKEEISHINHYYHTALDVIDAFGGILPDENGENPIQKIDLKQRFFTPTGKILTELASKWPEELQYDWLTRKVVGVFELKNLKPLPDSIFDTDILIIFSDYLLFLTINDTKYYLKKYDDPQKSISVSDILMHSLINEKPLPSLDIFPTMEVNGWCEINNVIASSYEATSTVNTEAQGDFLRFLSTKKYGFNSACKYSNFSKNYEILNTCEQENGNKIIEMITKSKVLQKTQSFHLFKSSANEDTDLTLYSTAHNIDAYEVETCKSAFALFLNITIDEPKKYFDTHPDLYLIVNASFVSDETIQLVGFTRDGNYELDEIILAQDLQKTLKKIISSNYEILFKSHNAITESLGNGYKNDLDYYLKVFTSYNSERLKMKEKQIEAERVAEENKRLQADEAKPKVAPAAVAENPKLNKKKSIISKFFRSFKKSNEETKLKAAPGQAPITKKISNTTIPKGSEVEYAHIYKPIPELKPHEHEQQTNDRVQRPVQLVNPKSRSPKSPARPSFNESTRTESRAVSIPQYSTETRYDQANLSQEDLQRLDGARRFSQEGLPHTTKTRVISFKPEPEMEEQKPEREHLGLGLEYEDYSTTYLPKPFTPRPIQHQRTISLDYSKSAIQHHSINAIRDYTRQFSIASKYTDNSSYGQVDNSPIFYDKNLTRSTTEENVAALDSIDKTRKKSQSPSSIPLMDLDLPIEEFYIDGESNWTLLASRDNSNLSQEVQKLKEEQQFVEHLPAVDQTERTISLRSVLEGQSTLDFGRSSTSVDQTGELMEQSMAEFGPDDRKSLNEIFKARHESSSTFEIPSNYFVRENREESMQSLTSTQIIEEFKNTIDFDSGLELNGPDAPVSRTISRNTSKGSNSSDSKNSYISSISDRTKDSSDSYRSNRNSSRPSFGGFGSRANPSNATLNSSDEEYYSPNEFDFGNSIYKMINDVQARSKQSLLISQKKQALVNHNNSSNRSLAPPTYSPNSSSPNTIGSNSSEATVTNDYSVSKPKLASKPSEQYFTRLASKDESIAFLSDLLNGSINL